MSRHKRRPKPPARKTPVSLPPPAQMALLLALAALPALFNIQSSTSFEPDKGGLIIALALIALVDILWRAVSRGHLSRLPGRISQLGRHPWMLLLAGLALWSLIITALSLNPVISLWGNHDRGYGLLTLLAGMLFLLIAWDMTRSGRGWLLVDAALLGAVIPILYGFAQMLDLDPVRGFGASFPLGERASSTLGNPLYLGDYLLIVIALALARRILHPPPAALARRILETFILAALALLTLTFSRSAYLGLLAAVVSLLIFLGIQQRSTPRHDAKSLHSAPSTPPASVFVSKWMLPAGLLALIGGATALILLWPRLQHGGTLQQRLLIWQAALQLLRSQPRALLAGLGFDALSLGLAPHLSPVLAHFEPDFVFRIPDRAHSLPLELLVTGGLPWLLGWLTLGGLALWRLARNPHPLAPWLAAIILGRGALLLVSFPTHTPDLLFWVILGMSFALPAQPNAPAPVPHPLLHLSLTIAAFGVIGFSLSAAWPGGLLLWLLTIPPLLALLYALAPAHSLAAAPLAALLFILLILPAILLDQRIGPAAQLAWMWLLLWLAALALFPLRVPPDWRIRVLQITIIALLMLLVALPRLGDIAYKSALLASDDYHRQQHFAKALELAPYDDIMNMGMAWVLSRRLGPAPNPRSPEARRITQLYEAATAPHGRAHSPEPVAAYARWLARLAANDPALASRALAAFDRALQLSPHDLQTLNDRAMLLAAMGRTDEAIAELQRLLTLDSLYGPTYRNLARVYRQKGDENAARAIIEQGKKNVPWWNAWEEEP